MRCFAWNGVHPAVGPARRSGPRGHVRREPETTFAADRENGPGGRAGNAVISERVKKCGRIKAPFASGGPPRDLSLSRSLSRRLSFGAGDRGDGNDVTAVGPRRNWFCIFMKALLTETARSQPRPSSSSSSSWSSSPASNRLVAHVNPPHD